MALQFSREEHLGRIAAARAKLQEQGLDALLIFAQESHYYLTGFDTNGYVFFQCAVLKADGSPMVLLTRNRALVIGMGVLLFTGGLSLITSALTRVFGNGLAL